VQKSREERMMRDVGPAAAADDGDDDDDGLTSRPPERRAADVDAPGRMHEVLESSRGLAAAFNAHRTGRFVDDFSSGLHRRGRARRLVNPSSSSSPSSAAAAGPTSRIIRSSRLFCT